MLVEKVVSQKQLAIDYLKQSGGLYFDLVNLGVFEKDVYRVVLDTKTFLITSSLYDEELQKLSQFTSIRSNESEICDDFINILDRIPN